MNLIAFEQIFQILITLLFYIILENNTLGSILVLT